MQNTTPASLSLESVSTDLLDVVQGGCHKHRHRHCQQTGAAPSPGVSGPVAGPQSGGPIFQQIMQIPAQMFQGYGQQSMGYDPSQFAAQSQPQSSGGEMETSVQVGQQ